MISIKYNSNYDMTMVIFVNEDTMRPIGFNYYWGAGVKEKFISEPDEQLTNYLLPIVCYWSRHWATWDDELCELIDTYLNEVRPVPIPQGFNESLRKVIKNWLEIHKDDKGLSLGDLHFRHDLMTWCAILENPMSVHISQTGIEAFASRNEFGVDFPEFVHNKTDK